MITEEQGQQQFDCADLIEAAVLKGRWKGIVPEKLWLVECYQGIMIEIELDKKLKGLRLAGQPDMTEDGQYLLRFQMDGGKKCNNPQPILQAAAGFEPHPVKNDPDILCQRLVQNDQIWEVCRDVLDALWAK